ncbi:MAG: drug/metabolite transporter (DMT)-like permease [Arenicella sp.]|jgi:drug/metabolite transporter (DMT)-like permease
MSARNIIELVVLAALWGASFLFMRIAVPEFGAVALIEARVLIAGLVLLPFWWFRESALNRYKVRQHWPKIFVVGLLNSAIPFVLFAYSMLYITGGMAAILNGTAPIWGAVVAWLWLKNRLALNGVIGLLIGFTGVVLLVSDELAVSVEGKAWAIAASAFAPLLYGVAANYTSEKLNDVSALGIATFSQLAAAFLLLPLLFWFIPPVMPSLNAWLALLALSILCTSVAYLMFFRLLAEIGSTRAITVTFLIPLFGSLWGAVFINEEITVMMMTGMAIILLGTALVMGVFNVTRVHKVG